MLTYTLLLLAIFSLVVFAVPSRVKASVGAIIIGVCTIFFTTVAISTLMGYMGFILPWGVAFDFVGENFTVDSLSALFILVVSVVALSVAIYAKGFMKEQLASKSSTHISLNVFSLIVLYLSMIGVLCFRDGYRFLVSWELMTISSFVLMLFDAHKREVRKAALNYIVLMHICFVFLLIGFMWLAKVELPVSFDSLGDYFAQHTPMALFVVFLLGFGIKAGLFPLHVWLPDAYTAAPSHVSAIMSGAMSKMGIYGLFRVVSYLETDLNTIGIILLVVGVVTALWGVLLSTMQGDMKRILAYSSIENIGIIVLALGVALIGKAQGNSVLSLCAVCGGLFHVLSHSMLKSVLFFSAGNIASQTGTTNIEELGGVAKRMPLTAIFTIVGVVAICALPPLCGFASEFLIYYGLFDSIASGTGGIVTSLCAMVTMAFVGGVVVVSFTKLYGVVFSGEPRVHSHEQVREVDSARIVAFTLPVMAVIFAGVFPVAVLKVLMPVAADYLDVTFYSTYLERMSIIMMSITKVVLLLIATVVLLLVVRRWLLRKRNIGQSPTWGCGFTAPSERMQYSGESFSEGLHSLVGSLSKNRVDGDVVAKNEIFPDEHSFKIGHKDRINELFTQWWVELVHKINVRVMVLRTGKVNYYILYALLFFAVIFLLTIFKLI